MSENAPACDAAWWKGDPAATPARLYDDSLRTSQYVTVSDGTKLAIDLFLPEGVAPDAKLPTILTITPYFRSMEFRAPAFATLFRLAGLAGTVWGHEMARLGYATVVMDMRGAGASFGRKRSLMMPDVVRDGSDMLDWIVAQPWSNGRVGSTGISALGMTGQWLATAKHPALKAIAPRFTVFDMYRALHLNGLLSNRFVADIGRMLRAMDSNRLWDTPEAPAIKALFYALVTGITPADDDRGRRLLAQAVAEHVDNEAFDQDIAGITFRDEELPVAGGGATLDTQAPASFLTDLEASGIPIYSYGGWFDAAFGREMISLHNSVRTPGSRLILGPWDHGAKNDCNPPVDGRRKSAFDQAGELARFFDLHLRDIDHAVADEDPVHYFTMGEGRWKSAPSWPPPAESVRWFLAPDGALADAPGEAGSDRYRVDFEAGTGVWSRFGKHLSGGLDPATYPERAERDRKLVVYDSPPFRDDVEMTGHAMAQLYLTSSETDGAVILYIEDVAPDGTVLNVTEGHLRLSRREVADEQPAFWHTGPFHTGNKSDSVPVTPGEVLQLDFDLLPVSWLFRSGHSIRVAIAGGDKDNFVRVPDHGTPVFEISRGGEHASHVVLPIVAR